MSWGWHNERYLFPVSLDDALPNRMVVCNAVGHFFERVGGALFSKSVYGGPDYMSDLLPDFTVGGSRIYEVKATGGAKFTCFARQLRLYEQAMRNDAGAQVFFLLFEYERSERLTGKIKRDLLTFLGEKVCRATLVPLQIISALIQHSDDWVTFGDTVGGWKHAGSTAYYSIKTRFTNSLHTDNGWTEQAHLLTDDFVLKRQDIRHLTVEIESEEFIIHPFTLVRVMPKKERTSKVDGVPF